MAAATKRTNSNARKEAARKAGKCQKCGAKTKGHSVVCDWDTGKVTKSPAGKAKQGYAYYCTDCADKKVKRLEWKYRKRQEDGTPTRKRKAAGSKSKAKAKPAAKKKAAKGTKAAPKKRTTKKATGSKAPAKPRQRKTKKAAADASAEPF